MERRDLDALLLSGTRKGKDHFFDSSLKNSLSEALRISNEYHLKDTIPLSMSILSGFYDVIGYPKDQTLPDLSELKSSQNLPFPVIIVDFVRDKNLSKIKKTAMSLCTPIPSPEIKARVLATLVCNFMGGSQLIPSPYKIKDLGNISTQRNEIVIGEITYGGIRERALLYKFLCDILKLPCQLFRKFCPDNRELKVWNEVIIGDQSYVVDLLHNAANLYLITSKEAQLYCNISFVDSLASYPFQVNDLDKQESSRWIDVDLQQANLDLIEEIGKGRYAVVYKSKLGGFICATKIIDLRALDKTLRKQMDRELEFLQALKKHPNVLTVFGHEYKQDKIYIYCELWHASLKNIIENIVEEKRPYISRDEVKIILLDICKALSYIHNLPVKVIHRDVKSQNVLVDVNSEKRISRAALCDFGVSKKVYNKPINASVGTSRFMAPEVHKGEMYNESVDMWSFGMMILELLSLKLPYYNLDYLEVKNHISKGNRPTLDKFPKDFEEFKILFENCTTFNPLDRWNSTQCLEYVTKLYQ